MKKVISFSHMAVPALLVLLFGALNPPRAMAVPSYARQTGWRAVAATMRLRNSILPDEDSSCSVTLIEGTTRKSSSRREAKRVLRLIFWLRCPFP